MSGTDKNIPIRNVVAEQVKTWYPRRRSAMTRRRLELAEADRDTVLAQSEHGNSGYTRTDSRDPRYRDAQTLLLGKRVKRGQIARDPIAASAERVNPQTQAAFEELIVKSRHRVKSYGEVFTPRYMVDKMLDLVREDLENGPNFVDKTFLEPAAGDGNFLVAILRRKLHAIEKWYPADAWPTESLFALASIYGIELLEDNHQDAKAVMLAEFHGFHQTHGNLCGPDTDLHQAAAFLIETNIVRGNTLTGLTPKGEDIQFSWWHRIDGKYGEVRRDPFTLTSLRNEGIFDFTVYDSYQTCRIEKVHEQEKTNA